VGLQRPWRETEQSSKSSAEVIARNYTSTPAYIFMAWCLIAWGQLCLAFTFLTNVYDYLAHHVLFAYLPNSSFPLDSIIYSTIPSAPHARRSSKLNCVMKITVFWDMMLCSVVNIYHTTQRHVPCNSNFHNHRRENISETVNVQSSTLATDICACPIGIKRIPYLHRTDMFHSQAPKN
jgi:hypothetical protein